ncbi:hypothetical protein [Streptomyces sp. NPDC047079]
MSEAVRDCKSSEPERELLAEGPEVEFLLPAGPWTAGLGTSPRR